MLAEKFRPPFEPIYILIACWDKVLNVTAVLKSEQTTWRSCSHFQTPNVSNTYVSISRRYRNDVAFLSQLHRRQLLSHPDCIRRVVQAAAATAWAPPSPLWMGSLPSLCSNFYLHSICLYLLHQHKPVCHFYILDCSKSSTFSPLFAASHRVPTSWGCCYEPLVVTDPL